MVDNERPDDSVRNCDCSRNILLICVIYYSYVNWGIAA